MIPGKQYTPDLIVKVAWRYKWRILLPAVVVGALSVAFISRLPNRYTSDTSILIVPQRVPESYVRPAVPTTRIDDRLGAITNQILSRTRLERVIQEFNLYPEARKTELMEDIVDRMRSDFVVRVLRSDAFTVSFTANDPRTAMKVTERLASYFIDESLKDREAQAEGTNQFLESQLEDARRKLEENEKRVEEFRRRYDGELPTQLDGNMQAMRSTEMQVQTIADAISRDRDRRLLVERQIAELSEPDAPVRAPASGDVQAGTAAEQLNAAKALLQAMQLRYRPEHPDVVRQKRIVAELQRRADAERTERPVSDETVSPAEKARRSRLEDAKAQLDQIDRQIAQRTDQEKKLRDSLADYQRRIEATPMRQADLEQLTRDYDTLQQTYRNLLAKKQESQIAANLERRQIGEQFKILDPARLPDKPSSPDRPRLYVLAIAGSLVLGLLCGAGSEYLDRTLKSEDDVRLIVNLPVLAVVPTIEPITRGRRRLWFASAAGVLALAAAAGAFTLRLLR